MHFRAHSDAPSTDSALAGTSAETYPGPDQQEAHQQESSPMEKVPIIVKDDWPNPELSPIFSTLVEPKWRSLLESELKKDYLKNICQFLEQQFSTVFINSKHCLIAFRAPLCSRHAISSLTRSIWRHSMKFVLFCLVNQFPFYNRLFFRPRSLP